VKPVGSGAECAPPVVINTVTGEGAIGDFKGRNRREGPVQIEFEFNKLRYYGRETSRHFRILTTRLW